MRLGVAWLAFGLLAAVPNPVWAQVESREGIALQNQILGLRQELEQLRRERGAPAAAALPAQRGTAPPPQGELVGRLLDRLSNVEEEVRRLRGQIEQNEFQNRQLGQNLEKLQGDVDFRLQQLEGRGSPPGGAPGRPATPNVAPPAGAPPAVAPAAAPRPPERAIADGQAALVRRDYPAAEAAAREALAVRGSPRATDAQLLLGDALTGKRDYPAAALAYNDAFARNRTSPRAPEALLGLAGAFVELGNRREACDTLVDLRRSFPTIPRPQAERAAALRQRAGCR